MVEGQCNNSNISLCTKIIASSLLLVKIHTFSALRVHWLGLWSRYLPARCHICQWHFYSTIAWFVNAPCFVVWAPIKGLSVHNLDLRLFFSWGQPSSMRLRSEFLLRLSTSPLRYCSLSNFVSTVRARIS